MTRGFVWGGESHDRADHHARCRAAPAKDPAAVGVYAIAALAALVCLTALFSEWIAPYDPNAQIFASLSPPSWEHWAGTDRYGRDLFSRILVGLRTSISATLSLVFIIMTTGTIVGMICGYRGGYVDTIMMRISDVCLAFPGLVLRLQLRRSLTAA